jgi:hypothetical protein
MTDSERRVRAGNGQADPGNDDDQLVVQRPTSDCAHDGSFRFGDDTSTLGPTRGVVIGRRNALALVLRP